MKVIHIVAWILIIIGALNWGLVGIGMFAGSNWNVVNLLIGSWSPQLEWLIYILVGLSCVWELVMHRKTCKVYSAGASAAPAGGTM